MIGAGELGIRPISTENHEARDHSFVRVDYLEPSEVTNLCSLSLQLCLGSHCRHMSKDLMGWTLSAQHTLARCFYQARGRQVRTARQGTAANFKDQDSNHRDQW